MLFGFFSLFVVPLLVFSTMCTFERTGLDAVHFGVTLPFQLQLDINLNCAKRRNKNESLRLFFYRSSIVSNFLSESSLDYSLAHSPYLPARACFFPEISIHSFVDKLNSKWSNLELKVIYQLHKYVRIRSRLWIEAVIRTTKEEDIGKTSIMKLSCWKIRKTLLPRHGFFSAEIKPKKCSSTNDKQTKCRHC